MLQGNKPDIIEKCLFFGHVLQEANELVGVFSNVNKFLPGMHVLAKT